ncbi:MAG TPA: maleylpyruvate isomerase family mycothiol-dependent enzyme [Acidimicrobiales bacterium]
MSDRLTALHDSVDRLSELVTGLDPDTLTAFAYPTEWSVADVLFHLGSGAVILLRRLDDGLAGVETPDDASRVVWDQWDAKSPEDQAADALVADRALLDRLEGLNDDERERFTFAMGPMTFDVDDFVGLRLNEHALHVWDVEVVLDPAAPIAPGSVAPVVDNLALFAGFTSKPTGTERVVTVVTTEPRRGFVVTLAADKVTLEPTDPSDAPDLVIPAEAFVRLVYGRLNPDHTPQVEGDDGVLDELRRAFPGG